ncbi:hypothetical protein ACUL0J_000637 [Listeria monocytogenes]|uniref:hypothetical protein n=1 Tax=Listeria innocua TaxID=1642 RepID=UPI0018513183|nr:hypothetical protein [Listeria innocua]EIB9701351.1 hypothetical protein [Listeria monocytogenes]MBC1385465.1 hypothetical protein [Listeria innocua]
MRGTKFFYVRAIIVTLIALLLLFVFNFDGSTVAICIMVYLFAENGIAFILRIKKHNK